MSGRDRHVLHLTALTTRARWSELRSLRRKDFGLDSRPRTLTIRAESSKHRREDILPLRDDVAQVLRDYLADRLSEARAFPMPGSDCGADMPSHRVWRAREDSNPRPSD